jgi:outer membrane receptor protein involved in Fe transport
VNDVLNNIPSVEVDQDGKISLRGDGNVTILIDGRPSTLSAGLLEAIPANSIERIEIVTNPSAKYDPDGTSGIINIVLKKNKLKGINGNVALSAGSGDVYNGATSLSVRNSKFNIYGTYAFRHYEGFRNNENQLELLLPEDVFRLDQIRVGADFRQTHTAKFGTDFYLKDRNTLGFSLSGNVGDRERTGTLNNEQTNGDAILLNTWKEHLQTHQ